MLRLYFYCFSLFAFNITINRIDNRCILHSLIIFNEFQVSKPQKKDNKVRFSWPWIISIWCGPTYGFFGKSAATRIKRRGPTYGFSFFSPTGYLLRHVFRVWWTLSTSIIFKQRRHGRFVNRSVNKHWPAVWYFMNIKWWNLKPTQNIGHVHTIHASFEELSKTLRHFIDSRTKAIIWCQIAMKSANKSCHLHVLTDGFLQ